jgi:hypothetical protein
MIEIFICKDISLDYEKEFLAFDEISKHCLSPESPVTIINK